MIVLGAGAAGMFCAAEAGRRGRRVLLVDHGERVGRKILISGGGRANFTNLGTGPENFVSENPHFARSALARYRPEEFVELVERHGIGWHEKAPGQLFCDRSAQDLVGMLERECAATGNVEVRLRTRVAGARHTGTEFVVETDGGELRAGALVVATGGLSIPKIGATGVGYAVAEGFGLRVVPTRPALVPLTLPGAEMEVWGALAGVSAAVVVRAGRVEFADKMLWTHRGLSGPAILQVSTYVYGAGGAGEVVVDLAPGRGVFAGADAGRAPRSAEAAVEVLRGVLPGRLAERWVGMYAPERWTNWELLKLEGRLHGWRVRPAGTEGYGKAEVTAGGVDTGGLDARTMEARAVPGLFFVGEVVDVTGWLGGYNFQWAWASAAAAGRAV